MEPTIYKPSTYKSPGIYKGTGGIYKGRGVYNDGAVEFVEIGGKKYPVVTIGYLKWIAYNLDYQYEGLQIGLVSTTSPVAGYYDNDELLNGWNGRKCGLLYNWYAMDYLNNNNLLPIGWRVPTNSDFLNLLSNVENNTNKLKLVDQDWFSGFNGTNETGFSIVPSGRWGILPNPNYRFLGTDAYLYTSDNGIESVLYTFDNSGTAYYSDEGYPKRSSASIRLCKDV